MEVEVGHVHGNAPDVMRVLLQIVSQSDAMFSFETGSVKAMVFGLETLDHSELSGVPFASSKEMSPILGLFGLWLGRNVQYLEA